jgi:hypothetical protein
MSIPAGASMSPTFEELKDRGMKSPTRVIHTQCGGIVFFHDGIPKAKMGIINPSNVVLANGAEVKDGDPIICPLCGYKVLYNQLAWVVND